MIIIIHTKTLTAPAEFNNNFEIPSVQEGVLLFYYSSFIYSSLCHMTLSAKERPGAERINPIPITVDTTYVQIIFASTLFAYERCCM